MESAFKMVDSRWATTTWKAQRSQFLSERSKGLKAPTLFNDRHLQYASERSKGLTAPTLFIGHHLQHA